MQKYAFELIADHSINKTKTIPFGIKINGTARQYSIALYTDIIICFYPKCNKSLQGDI